MVQRPAQGQSLQIVFWSQEHMSADRYETSSSQFRGDMWSSYRIVQPLLTFLTGCGYRCWPHVHFSADRGKIIHQFRVAGTQHT